MPQIRRPYVSGDGCSRLASGFAGGAVSGVGRFVPHCFWLSRTTGNTVDLSPASSGDNRWGADVGTPADCTLFVEDDKRRVELTITVGQWRGFGCLETQLIPWIIVGYSIRQIVKGGCPLRPQSFCSRVCDWSWRGTVYPCRRDLFILWASPGGGSRSDRFGAYRNGADEDCRGCSFYRYCGRSGSKTKRTHVSVHFAGTGLLVRNVAGTCGRGAVVNTAMTF
jgi:hypothetical protein